jgi:hypothetical protein
MSCDTNLPTSGTTAESIASIRVDCTVSMTVREIVSHSCVVPSDVIGDRVPAGA